MVIGRHRNTRAIISLEAIKHNVATQISKLKDGQSLFAVVKANAYGHGMIPVAKAAKEAGANGFCVAIIDEGIALRESGIKDPILILGVNPASEAVCMAKHDLSVAVGTLEFLTEAQKLLQEEKQRLKIHLALDTGMGRIGFRNTEDLKEAVDFIEKHSDQLKCEGVFTHFSTADSKGPAYFEKQSQKFDELVGVLKKKPKYIHQANSATALWHPNFEGNLVRMGISMYGLNPSGDMIDETWNLEPALSLESELVAVKEVEAGSSIGYGATYTSSQSEWIGTVPIGYADGWLRRMQGFKVLIDGQYCEIVGRVCMDQFMVRLPKKYDLGTKVTLIGENNGKVITAQDVANYADTIHYEIMCNITERVPRIYK